MDSSSICLHTYSLLLCNVRSIFLVDTAVLSCSNILAVRCSYSPRSLAHAHSMAGRDRLFKAVFRILKAPLRARSKTVRFFVHVFFFSIEDPSDVIQHEPGGGEDSVVCWMQAQRRKLWCCGLEPGLWCVGFVWWAAGRNMANTTNEM